MPLPHGTWDIVAGGQVGVLTFNTFTQSVTGTIFGDPFVGSFDEASQTLSLLRNPQVITQGGFSGVVATPFTVYQGSFFQFTSGTTNFGVLSGVFSANSGANTSPTYVTWYAQNPPPVKISKEGKDGKDHKDIKDKEQKDHKDKEPPDKLPEIHGITPFSIDLSSQSIGLASAMGRSFIEAEERPSVGESALRDKRLGDGADP
jgi:hypothetical protein